MTPTKQQILDLLQKHTREDSFEFNERDCVEYEVLDKGAFADELLQLLSAINHHRE